ncbi:hypothetical protein SAMN05421770_101396 [Granulicella rosea]|uniref:Uncharacterized protein n=1 Tax=Granulicella rosea TaxID=474952 RepID=A0A239DC91_9BACT|nr:hypothetical protein [Granulicella rosea]SNS29940.1 hypothetical protein SAMN05421770_101396 [Granulicella rosea]
MVHTAVVDSRIQRRLLWAALATALTLGLLIAPHVAAAQASSSITAQSAPAIQTPVAPARPRRRRRAAAAASKTQPAPATTPIRTDAQREQDARLLAQQQAASQATKAVNDAQVQAYDANRRKVQNEPRIQDAPTMQEAPRAPVTPDPEGIHDAPGPADTAPVQLPTLNTTPATPAPAPPPQ